MTDDGAQGRTTAAEVEQRVGAADVLSSIRTGYAGYSANYKRIAQLFLETPDWAVTANIEELAARAAVSAPTIVRFARAIGCEGLKDLKLKIAGALALGAPFLHRAVHAGDSPHDVMRNVVGSVTTALADWQSRIDPTELDRVAEIVVRARRIDCLCAGATSHFLAQDLQARLFRLGLNATAFMDAHYQLVAAATLTPDDVVIAISYIGRMPTLLSAVELAKLNGAPIVALTTVDAPLAKMADMVVPMDVPRDTTMLVGTDAYMVQLITIEILMIMVGLKLGGKVEGRLGAVQQALQRFSVDSEDPSVLHAGWQKLFGR